MLDDDVWRYLPLGPVPMLAALVLGVMLLGCLVVRARRSPGVRDPLVVVALGLVVASVLAVTLAGAGPGEGAQVNLVPGDGVRTALDSPNRELGLVNVLGNVALFVPVGWLLVLSLLVWRSARAVLLGAVVVATLLSVGIEVVQLGLGRAADVDDVLLNALGALLGGAVASGLSPGRTPRPATGRRGSRA